MGKKKLTRYKGQKVYKGGGKSRSIGTTTGGQSGLSGSTPDPRFKNMPKGAQKVLDWISGSAQDDKAGR